MPGRRDCRAEMRCFDIPSLLQWIDICQRHYLKIKWFIHRGGRRVRRVLGLFQSLLRFSDTDLHWFTRTYLSLFFSKLTDIADIFNCKLTDIFIYSLTNFLIMRRTEILRILVDWNYWGNYKDESVERGWYIENLNHLLKTGEIIVIKGVRRSGKSTFMLQYINKLGLEEKNALVVNFEFKGDLR